MKITIEHEDRSLTVEDTQFTEDATIDEIMPFLSGVLTTWFGWNVKVTEVDRG